MANRSRCRAYLAPFDPKPWLDTLGVDLQLKLTLNAACRIANQQSLTRLKQIKSLLRSQRDTLPDQTSLNLSLPQDHDNIRGPNHFH